jgi:hypothetical protein
VRASGYTGHQSQPQSTMPCYAVFLLDLQTLRDPTLVCDVKGALSLIDAFQDPPLWAWVRASGYGGKQSQLVNLEYCQS